MPTTRMLVVALMLASGLLVVPAGAPTAAAAVEMVEIASYDVTQTPMSGFGCWTHEYDGTIVDTGRMVEGYGWCGGGNEEHLANYTGGSGTLNDGVISTSTEHNQLLLTTVDATDGLPVEPVITLHLARPAYVKRISVYGGDIMWNAIPGALTGATIVIEGKAVTAVSQPFGPVNALGMPSSDLFDIDHSEQSWLPTSTILLKDFQAELFGFQFSQFSISEIVVEGDPMTPVAIDVKPGDRDPVTVNPGRGTLPVAILGSATFDVADIEVGMGELTFGVFGWEMGLRDCGRPQDVNKDRVPDLVCHFVNYSVDWSVGDGTVALNGWTKAGARFHGSDTIAPPR